MLSPTGTPCQQVLLPDTTEAVAMIVQQYNLSERCIFTCLPVPIPHTRHVQMLSPTGIPCQQVLLPHTTAAVVMIVQHYNLSERCVFTCLPVPIPHTRHVQTLSPTGILCQQVLLPHTTEAVVWIDYPTLYTIISQRGAPSLSSQSPYHTQDRHCHQLG